jgi:hypothetical protein
MSPHDDQQPTQAEPVLQLTICSNLEIVHQVLAIQAQALQQGPKSPEREMIVTKLREARLWTEEALRAEAVQVVQASSEA